RLLAALALTGLLAPLPAQERSGAKDSRKAPPPPDLDRVGELVVDSVNRFREEKGRGKLRVNPQLTAAARYFAGYLARTGKFSHTADGKGPAERAVQYGSRYCLVLENIAYQYSSRSFTAPALARKLVEGWKGSPGHRKNMLDPDVFDTGVAVAQSPRTGKFYAVQMFGRPESEKIVFQISNRTKSEAEYTVDGQTYTIRPGYTVTHTRCRPPVLALTGAAL